MFPGKDILSNPFNWASLLNLVMFSSILACSIEVIQIKLPYRLGTHTARIFWHSLRLLGISEIVYAHRYLSWKKQRNRI